MILRNKKTGEIFDALVREKGGGKINRLEAFKMLMEYGERVAESESEL